MENEIKRRETLYNERFRPLYIKFKRGLFLSESDKVLVNQMIQLRHNLLCNSIFIKRELFLKSTKAYISDGDEFVIFAIIFRRQLSECLEDAQFSHLWSLTNTESKKFFEIPAKQREFAQIINDIDKLIGHVDEHILLVDELKILNEIELKYNKLLDLSRQ